MREIPVVARRNYSTFQTMEPLESRHLLSAALSAVLIAPPAPHVAASTAAATIVTPIPITIQAFAGLPFAGDVGEISGLSPALLAHLKAFINWGDGPTPISGAPTATTAPSPGTIYFDAAGILHVRGTHTYQKAGMFPVTVTVVQSPPAGTLPPTLVYTINSKAVVTTNSLGGVTIHAATRVSFTGIVGYFNVPPSPIASAVAPVLRALINWGDGSVSIGTIQRQTSSATNAFTFDVQGTHTYTNAGTFRVSVTVYEQFPGLVGPTPLLASLAADPLWIRLIAQINSTAIVLATPVTPG